MSIRQTRVTSVSERGLQLIRQGLLLHAISHGRLAIGRIQQVTGCVGHTSPPHSRIIAIGPRTQSATTGMHARCSDDVTLVIANIDAVTRLDPSSCADEATARVWLSTGNGHQRPAPRTALPAAGTTPGRDQGLMVTSPNDAGGLDRMGIASMPSNGLPCCASSRWYCAETSDQIFPCKVPAAGMRHQHRARDLEKSDATARSSMARRVHCAAITVARSRRAVEQGDVRRTGKARESVVVAIAIRYPHSQVFRFQRAGRY